MFEALNEGRFRAFLPAASSASIQRTGRELGMVALLESGEGEAVHAPVEGVTTVLGLHDRATLSFAGLKVVARYMRPVAKRFNPFGRAFYARVVLYLLLALAAERWLLRFDGVSPAATRDPPTAFESAR